MHQSLKASTRVLLPALLALLGCNSPESLYPLHSIPDDGSLLRIVQDSLFLQFSLSARLDVSRTDSAGHDRPAYLQWVSRDTGVVSVDAHGGVSAAGVGRTWIVVSDLKHQDSARVVSTASYISIHAGIESTCALTTQHLPLCWGWNGFGALGNGTTVDSSTPVPVANMLAVQALVGGGGTTCAVSLAAWCWGWNAAGMIGDGTIKQRLVPQAVADTFLFSRLTLGAGANACGFTLSSAVICWGSNGWGQLLLGGTTNLHRPMALNSGVAFVAVATGGGHVCGLDATGTPWCWGRNDRGQAGAGEAVTTVPAMVAGGPPFVSLTAGREHVCGRTAGGQVWCWGDNSRGQLGVNGRGVFSTTPALAVNGMTLDTVTSTAYHTCGLAAHVAWCWGDNTYGQLGDGSRAGSQSDAVQVAGGLRFASISTGLNHTCGVTTSGVAYCWGRNGLGALGIGDRIDRTTPVRVAFQ